ncbi:hypothetical protein ERX37_11085 [Macrococcus hajekii]|uniref:MvdD-like pre-ATP grasp domain-containing protein n=1 Tax=Macrococcus hajekii TaxID=198482 RepID=A0A4R6BHH4_9STAP|nr:hypothetical protein [Macrococcus hajekii]TDM01013.1 hypothetical protein ERX37_11085 [Macrococcus hajekii]GGB13173.1 ATP-grasp ribosomal peptide maturase [Macrococcus hajekii]
MNHFLISRNNQTYKMEDLSKDWDYKNNYFRIFEKHFELETVKNKVLILTRIHDDEVNYLIPKLLDNNIDYLRLDIEYFIKNTKIQFNINNEYTSLSILYKGKEYDMSSFNLIWFRHFNLEGINYGTNNEKEKAYLKNEWKAFINYLFLKKDIKWINHPHYSLETSKYTQLIYAQSIGMNIPNTVVTNNLELLQETLLLPEEVFIKSSKHHFYEFPEGVLNAVYGTTEYKRNISNIENTPLIFQEIITNAQEVRITCFDEKCFGAVHINKVEGDWHTDDIKSIKLHKIDIPLEISVKCIELLKKLNLEYGAFDFFLIDNTWIFIEVNPIGDWRWVELKTDLAISENFLQYLKKELNMEE